MQHMLQSASYFVRMHETGTIFGISALKLVRNKQWISSKKYDAWKKQWSFWLFKPDLTLLYIAHISFCVRLNDAPVRGYEGDVGNKTTLRLFYPESAFYNPGVHNDPDTLQVLVPFKQEDLRWLKEILYDEKRVSLSHFFSSCASMHLVSQ